MPLSCGRRLPFRRLQSEQAGTTLTQVVRPPRERGMTWSKVSSCDGKGSLQYWQTNRSRRKTLNLVKAGRRAAGMYSLSEMTLGSRISKLGLRTTSSYSEMMLTRSRKTALTVSCHDHRDSGKYDNGRKSAFRTSAGQLSKDIEAHPSRSSLPEPG